MRKTYFKGSRARGQVEKVLYREVVQTLNTAPDKYNLDLVEDPLNCNLFSKDVNTHVKCKYTSTYVYIYVYIRVYVFVCVCI